MTSLEELLNGVVLGVHLVSAHSAPGMNDNNTGVYLRTPAGFTVGTYENSISRTRLSGNDGRRRISTYAGWSWETPGKSFAFTLGGVTGYGREAQDVCVETGGFGDFSCTRYEHLERIPSVVPLAVASGRVPLAGGWSARMGYMYVPAVAEQGQRMHVANLMLELGIR